MHRPEPRKAEVTAGEKHDIEMRRSRIVTQLPFRTRALFPCNLCTEAKPREAFRGAQQKQKDVKKWRCKECQQPPCITCGGHPETPLPGGRAPRHAAELKQYRCTTCLAAAEAAPQRLSFLTRALFPCKLCKERKPRGAFRVAKQKCKDLTDWRCQACQQPPCTACGKNPEAPLRRGRSLKAYRCTTCLAAAKGARQQ